ncbi:hypothetical protein BH11ARM2_BH11ARM2_12620 [soil metagenome]
MSLIPIPPFVPANWLPHREGDDLWLIPGIIPRDGVVVLASAPKTGKTCLATAMARSIACGTPFLGHTPEQGPILWCAHEEIPDERGALHAGLTNEDPFYVAYPGYLPTIDAPEPYIDRMGIDHVEGSPTYVFDQAVQAGAKLIVIDCLHAAVERGNLADNFFARRVMGRLRRLSWMRHIPVLVLHHLTKSNTRGHATERFADSAQILASASCHFYMERREEEDGTHRITLRCACRHPAPSRSLELISRGILDYEIANDAGIRTGKRETALARIQNLLAEGWELTAEEIATRLRLTPTSVRNALARLTHDGLATKIATGARRSRYRLDLEGNGLSSNEKPSPEGC